MTETERQTQEHKIWDRFATSYDENVLSTYTEAYRLTIDNILKELPVHANVLELGCGTGIIALALTEHVESIIGIDLSTNMLAVARRKAQDAAVDNVSFVVGDAYHLDYADQTFEVILVPNLLYLVSEPETVLAEAHRLLKPRGLLVTVTDCAAEPGNLKAWFKVLGLRLMKIFGTVRHLHFFKHRDLKNLVRAAGFEIQHETVLHPTPVNYYLSARKI